MKERIKINYRKQTGITLIALVITIIVLLILAGVSILTVTGNNGILAKASTAKNQTKIKSVEEQVKLAVIGSYGQDGKVDLDELKDNLNKISGITGVPENINFPFEVTIDGQNVELILDENNNVTVKIPEEGVTTTYTAYNIGDEVTVGGENFYVLEASDENTSTVTLFSKYNLNKEGTAQSNTTFSETACAFSSTAYWDSIEGKTDPFNLNNVQTDVGTDAINKAKSYAKSKGATNGRLLTYEELFALNDSYSSMLYGIYTTDGYLIYWLGSLDGGSGIVYAVSGFETLATYRYDYGSELGVRPVITISKSFIS